jgi:2-polyprenyl-3-methyl-5-hydroxy-6-metoxy-1,4-benzoquinol methylase
MMKNQVNCLQTDALQKCGRQQSNHESDGNLVRYEKAKAKIVVRNLVSHFGLVLRRKRVLEIGCSTGALMEMLEGQGADAYGVDIDSSWSCNYYYRPEKRILLDIQENDLPAEWENRGFDLVVAQEVIEHIKRPYDFLHRIWRVLNPTGCLFLTTPNLTGITALLKGEKWCGVSTEGHVILYSPKSMDFTVCNCGFRRMGTFTNFVPIVYQNKYPWLWWINRAFAMTGRGGGLTALYQKVRPTS